jgi:succinyl-CoA synthetase beta subunit
MNIHEYQAKAVLSKYGVTVPKGKVADTPAQAEVIAEEFGTPVVVKAQIHAGGRGKGGGVKLARTSAEARKFAQEIIGMNLVTPQTGPGGKKVKRVLVEQAGKIQRELYLGIVIDRAVSQVVVMASTEGGMEIETVAARTPEKILKEWVNPAVGLLPFQARKLAFGLGIPKELTGKAVKMMTGLYNAFVDTDCSLVEINPLVLTEDGEIVALDAKMNFESNGLYRHQDIQALRDFDEEDPTETEASNHDLSYIRLDGNIGCMVNGAGLAMATMDIIKHFGGEPANFLDIGGSSSPEKVVAAMQIITQDPNVRAILFNIFGGITRCDDVAQGIVAALEESPVALPIVVRLTGTNEARAREILAQAKGVIPAESMDGGVKQAIKAAGEGS